MTELEQLERAVAGAIHIPRDEARKIALALHRAGFRRVEPAPEPFTLTAPGEEPA